MFKPVHLLVCDDIRYELRGKLTLVGTYGRRINVGRFPAQLRFCYRLELQFDQIGPIKATFGVEDSDGKGLFEVDMDAHVGNIEETSVIPMGPFGFAAPNAGEYKAFFQIEGRDREIVGSFLLGSDPSLTELAPEGNRGAQAPSP